MINYVFFGPSLFKGSILVLMRPNFQGEPSQISHKPSQAEPKKSPASAESELSRAELSPDASLVGRLSKIKYDVLKVRAFHSFTALPSFQNAQKKDHIILKTFKNSFYILFK